MSIPKSERKENRFQLPLRAREVASHTLKITSNENVFPKHVAPELRNQVNKLAMEIYFNVKTANDLNLFEHKTIREKYQREAYADCIRLIALIDLTIPVYHIHKRRAAYWCSLVLEVRDGIKKWVTSDNKRYNSK